LTVGKTPNLPYFCLTKPLHPMKPKKSPKKLRITQADYMLAQRRAARMEEIAEHGKPVSMRSAVHRSKKVYDRKRLKKIDFD
jgi:hypothetical protein